MRPKVLGKHCAKIWFNDAQELFLNLFGINAAIPSPNALVALLDPEQFVQIVLSLPLTLPCSGVSHLVLTQHSVHQFGTIVANPITRAAHSCETPVWSLFHF